jgi:hypothetical protein
MLSPRGSLAMNADLAWHLGNWNCRPGVARMRVVI